jgi:hypothetical protein
VSASWLSELSIIEESNVKDETISGLEQFSLRWARASLIGAIALGCLTIAGGLIVAGGAWLYFGPKKPEILPPPEPEKLTLRRAEGWLKANEKDAIELEQAAFAMDAQSPIPAVLSPLFPDPPYTTVDIWEDYCKTPSGYGCIQKGKRLKVASIGRTFAVLFREFDEKGRNDFVKVLLENLPSVPVENRLRMVAPIMVSYVQLKRENQEAMEAYETKANEANEVYISESKSHRDGQVAYSIGGLWVALWGLGTVVSASVFVALLAIERHLRALRSKSLSS